MGLYSHPGLLLALIPVLLFNAIYLTSKPGFYEMDFCEPQGTFISIYGPYSLIGFAIFFMGMAGAFLFSLASPVACLCLLYASLEAIVFNAWLLFRYESYLHARYPRDRSQGSSNYSAVAYAVTKALGASALGMFVAGSLLAVKTLMER